MRFLPDMADGSTYCRRLSDALLGLAVRNDAAARSYARRALLDTLGAALAGTTAPEFRILCSALGSDGSGAAPVWGTDLKLSAGQAALANGTAAHALEVDDFGGCGHSGAVVIPAALAAMSRSEVNRSEVSGAELIDAILIGYEAAARVTDAMGGYPVHNANGWHSTGTCGVFGAAAAAASILKLDAERFAHALALAGSYAGGTWSFMPNGAMNKRLHAGKAAEAGVTAALLAEQGFTGPLHLFDPIWGGFLSLYAGEDARPEALVAPHPDLLVFRSGFKPYACCRGCHSALDVVLARQSEHGFTADEVERVDIFGSEQTVRQLGKRQVETVLDAQMSLPYSVAVALTHGNGALRYYQPPYLADPGLNALAARIQVFAETAGAARQEPRLEIRLRDGTVLEGRVDIAKGASANPLSDSEIEDKFMDLATMAVKAEHASAIVAMVSGIDDPSSAAPILALLEGGGPT